MNLSCRAQSSGDSDANRRHAMFRTVRNLGRSPQWTMDETLFAAEVNEAYRAVYLLGARRVADSRMLPSPEAVGLLWHLAQSGPLTLSEMSRHLQRAPSTLSVKVASLETQGLLTRQQDSDDARRALVWLTPKGREALDEAMHVLDHTRLREAGRRLSATQRSRIAGALRELHEALALHRSPEPEGDT